jgi:homocysteine S-methyltransferase
MERGIRANASKRSHAELDAAPDLDAGDPAEAGGAVCGDPENVSQHQPARGCCSTDPRHIEASEDLASEGRKNGN